MSILLDLDERRRTTLKLGHHSRYLAEELPDGTLVLHPAVFMPEAQARLLAAQDLLAQLTDANALQGSASSAAAPSASLRSVTGDFYTPLAEAQLDALQAGADAALYNAVLDVVDHVLDQPESARATSPALRDNAGKPILAAIVRYELDPRWFVFWRLDAIGPVILGVGPLPAASN